ncbi:MAG: ABC transporter ATP-binding protein [Planctomycetota bacterium]
MTEPWVEDDQFHGRLDLKLWGRIARHVLPYKRWLVGLASCGVAVAAMEIALPLITGRLIDAALAARQAGESAGEAGLAGWLAAYGVAAAALAGLVYLFIAFAGRLATATAYDLREKGFARLQQLSLAYFDRRPVGWLVTRLTSDCSKIANMIPWVSLDLFFGVFLIAGIAATMLVIDWRLGLVMLLVFPPLAVVSGFFQSKLLKSSRLIRRTNSRMTASYAECIAGVRTTKTLVREDRNLDEFRRQSGDMYRYSMRNHLQSAVYMPTVVTLTSLGVGIAIWQGGERILGVAGAAQSAAGLVGLTLGELVMFMQFAALFSMPIQDLARWFAELQRGQAAAERIQSLIDEAPEITDSDAVVAAIGRQRAEPVAGMAEDGRPDSISTIEFRGVSFAYGAGEEGGGGRGVTTVLDGFDLKVAPGETLALVGPTGHGKSTIVSLAARFYEPTAGEVLIDGVDYRERSLLWYQGRLGVVQQAPHLFGGTVRENIRYGRLDATDEEVEAAARAVSADGFIRAMEKGYETRVGEGGAKLSVGQRQLISIARALLSDPSVVILDEATSSIDTEAERAIQSAVATLLEGRIAFVIAHRLSTIRAADRILVIEHGRIAEEGTHEALIVLGGRYRALYERQAAGLA